MKKLAKYVQKRRLNRTPEPGPSLKQSPGQYLVFVVHKHAARQLHYDLRLEMDGVLKSFAVPKGPSLDPAVKRLAMMVEDHPFDYRNFEGIIPKGNYGAGSVIIWDRGLYGHPGAKDRKENEKLLLDGLKKGVLKFALLGQKLKGGFSLVKTKWQKNSWLLLKEHDKYATADDILKKDRSVASGMTIGELGTRSPELVTNNSQLTTLPPAPMPHRIRPMLSTAVKKPFNHPDWIFEVKWDGYRAIAELNKKNVLLYSRNQLPLAQRFPSIVSSLQKLGQNAVLDGEVIAVDKQGLPRFQMLQGRENSRLIYYVFDLLYYNGRDIRNLPLLERKELLKKILPADGNIRYAGHVQKDGIAFFKAAKEKKLEGIVAKYSKSPYLAGLRTRHWLKIKNKMSQDCVIAGFTAPHGSRRYFGSLVLGVYEKGKLIHAGRSGGGFSARGLKEMHEILGPLAVKKCPFKDVPEGSEGITWVKPELVCEVEFTEWTKEGVLRHPVFVKLREDKNAAEAVKEN